MDLHQDPARPASITPSPPDRAGPLDIAPDLGEGELDELAHAVRLAVASTQSSARSCCRIATSLDVVAGVAPIPPGVEVAEQQLILQAELDRRHRAGDLAGDERLAPRGLSWLNRIPLRRTSRIPRGSSRAIQ